MSDGQRKDKAVQVRSASAHDDQALQALQARCPMGTTLVVSTVNTPDFYGRARAYPWYHVYTACHEGELAGSAACAVRDGMLDGHPARIGYEFQYFTAPEHRRAGVARALHCEIEKELRAQGALLSYLVTIEGNEPALALFRREGFALYRTLVMPGMFVYRVMDEKANGRTIRTATEDDLEQVAALANATWRGCALYEPATAASLAAFIERTPAFEAENLLVLVEGSEVVAALGYWDWSRITRLTVLGLGLKLRLASRLLDVASGVLPLPPGVHTGDTLKQAVLTPIAYRSPADLSVLVRRVNNACLARGIGQIFAVCETGHPMLGALKGLFHLDSHLHLLVKPLSPEGALPTAPVYLDGRDL